MVRKRMQCIIVGGGFFPNSVSSYDFVTNKFTQLANAPLECISSCAAVVGNFVYVAGGNNDKSGRCIQVYNEETDEWTVHKDILQEGIYGAAVVVFNSKLYIIGGFDKSKYFSSIEVIAVDGVSCTLLPHHNILSLKRARAFHSAVIIGKRCYVIGGVSDGDIFLSDCESFDVVTGEHHLVASLNQARYVCASVVHGNHIYAVGGAVDDLTALSSVEVFSTETNEWTTTTSLNVYRHHHCATTYNDEIYVYGGICKANVDLGVQPGDCVNNIERYSLSGEDRSWQIHRATDVIGRYGSCAVILTESCEAKNSNTSSRGTLTLYNLHN